MKVFKMAFGAIVLASVLAGSSLALAAGGRPTGGKVTFYVTPGTHKDKILATGAIGDYGTALSVDKNGKPSANGNFEKISLKQGGFEVDATQLNKALSHLQPTVNRTTCSFDFSGSGPGTLLNGTGQYAGISGKLTINVTFASIAPRFKSGAKKGKCNLSQKAAPLAEFTSITASGKVSFG